MVPVNFIDMINSTFYRQVGLQKYLKMPSKTNLCYSIKLSYIQTTRIINEHLQNLDVQRHVEKRNANKL